MKKKLTIGLAAALACGTAFGELPLATYGSYQTAYSQARGQALVAQAMANTDPAELAGRQAAAGVAGNLGPRVMRLSKKALESKAKAAAKVAIRKQPREDYKSYRERAKRQTEKFVEGYLAYVEDFKECVEASARTGTTVRPSF